MRHVIVHITKTILLLLALSLPSLGLAAGDSAIAAAMPVQGFADSTLKTDACAGLNQLDNNTNPNCSNLDTQGNGFSDTVKTVVEILSWVVGVISIIMIIVSGLKYMTSGGDANKVGAAKSTLIYALLGLAIAVVAQVLVRIVITTATKNVTGG